MHHHKPTKQRASTILYPNFDPLHLFTKPKPTTGTLDINSAQSSAIYQKYSKHFSDPIQNNYSQLDQVAENNITIRELQERKRRQRGKYSLLDDPEYTINSSLGHTLATLGANGNLNASNTTLHRTGPFGEVISQVGVLGGNNNAKIKEYANSAERRTENDYAVKFITMGARLYIPSLGRFTSVDPIKGGTQNDYVYPSDPVNGNDFSGKFSFFGINLGGWGGAIALFARPAVPLPEEVYVGRGTLFDIKQAPGASIRLGKGSTGGPTAGGKFSEAEKNATRLQAYKDGVNKCPNCQKPMDPLNKKVSDADHIVSRVNGGNREPENRQILCISCNRSKGSNTGELYGNTNPNIVSPMYLFNMQNSVDTQSLDDYLYNKGRTEENVNKGLIEMMYPYEG
jgi:RHS repeat-associated protein